VFLGIEEQDIKIKKKIKKKNFFIKLLKNYLNSDLAFSLSSSIFFLISSSDIL